MALDATGRSTADSVQNTTYSDLSMTQYPKVIDSRSNNLNMQGFVNVQDATSATPLTKMWNMAEHVNALADAVMAIQRVLGINPHIDVNGQANAKGTVDGRIDLLEDPDQYDARYGGTGWILGQNLVGHTHTGETGHPSKIDLVNHVQGLLKKSNIDLTTATGLTGADIAMNSQVSTKISDAIADKLSTSQGGTVNADLAVTGKFQSRTHREWNNEDVQNGTKITTYGASSGIAYRGAGTADVRFIDNGLDGFEYGKYVVGVRLRIDSLPSEQVGYIRVYNTVGGVKTLDSSVAINGTDFDAVNSFKMFYLVCSIKGDASSSISSIQIGKDSTNASVNLDFDHAFIMPVHPAIFDK